jgi:hypothetical protein
MAGDDRLDAALIVHRKIKHRDDASQRAPTQPFDAPAKALLNGDKQGLFLWCFEHCRQAFVEVFQYEEILCGSLWRFDHRYYELSMNLLYERFCYAMTSLDSLAIFLKRTLAHNFAI